MIDLKGNTEKMLTGRDNIVIVKYLDGLVGGRSLDVTDYKSVCGKSVVEAGTVIITNGSGTYKPMAIVEDTDTVDEQTVGLGTYSYGSLPSGYSYAGFLVASIDAEKDGAAIMTRGKINKAVVPFALTSILSAVKTALPLIEFTEDNA